MQTCAARYVVQPALNKLCGARYVAQPMWCNLWYRNVCDVKYRYIVPNMLNKVCGAKYVVQSMWCDLRDASYLVQLAWFNLCGVRTTALQK